MNKYRIIESYPSKFNIQILVKERVKRSFWSDLIKKPEYEYCWRTTTINGNKYENLWEFGINLKFSPTFNTLEEAKEQIKTWLTKPKVVYETEQKTEYKLPGCEAIEFAEWLRTWDALTKENNQWCLDCQVSTKELYNYYKLWLIQEGNRNISNPENIRFIPPPPEPPKDRIIVEGKAPVIPKQ